ncbi:MAG: hypothetical protein AAF607_17125 [Pseudomonadota bacterium]
MTMTFTRLYETEAIANEVAAKVKAIDFVERSIDVIAMPMEGEPILPIAGTLGRLGVYETAAAKYAAKMMPGNALVVVRAPFGTGGRVPAVLDSVSSIDAGVASEANLGARKMAPDNIIRVSGTRSIIRKSGTSSITKKRAKPRTKPYKSPTPFLGITAIIKTKKKARRPSNGPLTKWLLPLVVSR